MIKRPILHHHDYDVFYSIEIGHRKSLWLFLITFEPQSPHPSRNETAGIYEETRITNRSCEEKIETPPFTVWCCFKSDGFLNQFHSWPFAFIRGCPASFRLSRIRITPIVCQTDRDTMWELIKCERVPIAA